jgi:DNA-binding NarL/FixJ family response regulator
LPTARGGGRTFSADVPRVLIVNFGVIARRGLLGFLDDAGVDVITESSEENAALRLREAPADVVLLNLDTDGASTRARALADSFPGVKVIACSAEQPTMLVLPPNGGGSYMSTLTSARLEAEVMV